MAKGRAGHMEGRHQERLGAGGGRGLCDTHGALQAGGAAWHSPWDTQEHQPAGRSALFVAVWMTAGAGADGKSQRCPEQGFGNEPGSAAGSGQCPKWPGWSTAPTPRHGAALGRLPSPGRGARWQARPAWVNCCSKEVRDRPQGSLPGCAGPAGRRASSSH